MGSGFLDIKKFTPIEMRYGISEIYAIFWVVKKFEYELGGKKFKIETDHKVLVKFRNKQALKIIEITDGLKRCNNLISLLNKENRKG